MIVHFYHVVNLEKYVPFQISVLTAFEVSHNLLTKSVLSLTKSVCHKCK